MGTNNWRKGNKYDLNSCSYGVGFDSKGRTFKFSLDDYDKIKPYTWYVNPCHKYVINNRESIRMHRFVMNISDDNDVEVDHINGDKSDNRRENLRIVTHQQNNFNKPKNKNNTSGYKGVHWRKDKNCWDATIMVNYKNIHLGLHKNVEDAINARKIAEEKYFKEFNYKEKNI